MKTLYLLASAIAINSSIAGAQTIDNTFHEPLPIRPTKIECIKVLSDGKILLGGDIAFFNTKRVNNLIRLNADNTLDETFNFLGSNLLLITKVEIQSSGNILVLGRGYNSISNNYTTSSSLFQLEPNGYILKEIDSLSNPNSITLQKDNKILVCGYNNFNKGYLYRFNSDLTSDSVFNQKLLFDNNVTDVKVDSNKLIVSGWFSIVNGITENDIVKLNLDGIIDTTFNTGTGTSDVIGSLAVQADHKIIIAKSYINSFNGQPCKGIVRLNPDGSIDDSFTPPYLNSMTSDIVIRDSSVYVSAYLSWQADYASFLFKLKSDGSFNAEFTPVKIDEIGFIDFCLDFKGNNIIFNNSSTTGNKFGLSMCDSIGNLITSFTPAISRYGVISIGDYFNGKFLVAGDFMRVNNTDTYGLSMLDKNGVVDDSFILPKNLGSVIQLQILNDSIVFVSTGNSFLKLNDKGQIVRDFNFKKDTRLYEIIKFKALINGKIMAADANDIYRLNSDGTEDSTFVKGIGISPSCTGLDFDLQGDRIIWGSDFDSYNGTDVHKLIRLRTDASIDSSFNIGTGPDNIVLLIKVLTPHGIIIGGWFNNFNAINIPHGIVMLSDNGEINQSFNENQKMTNLDEHILSIDAKVEQVDSVIIVKENNRIFEFNMDGTLNNDFNMPISIKTISDIITIKDSSQNISGRKSGSTTSLKKYIFALGTFYKSDNTDPSFVIKLDLGENTISSIDKNEINHYSESQFKIYPNPAGETLKIYSKEKRDHFGVTIYNLIGEKVIETKYSNDADNFCTAVNISNLLPGLYFVNINSGSRTIFSQKFVKLSN